MMKLLKINVALELKGDPRDSEELYSQVCDHLEMLIESGDLSYEVLEEDDYEEDEG